MLNAMFYRKKPTVMILAIAISCLTFESAQAKPAKKKASKAASKTSASVKTAFSKTNKKEVAKNTDWQFDDAKRTLRKSGTSEGQIWATLSDFDKKISDLTPDRQINLLQQQSKMLLNDGYPVLAAQYAAESLKILPKSNAPSLKLSWLTLADASSQKPMQNMIESLASKVDINNQTPPGFGNNWYYYAGNAAQSAGNARDALSNYGKLRINDMKFLPGQYQTAMIHLANDRVKQAEISLKTMLNATTQTLAPIDSSTISELSNYAKIGLARIYYQEKRFQDAIKFYRSVDRSSSLFYPALFEQSWAFFMAGYPNHSLGALYSVESPFFKDKFNPESTVLKAIIYYWMCRYENSKGALSDFTKKYGDSVDSLGSFLARKRLSNETAYELLENYVNGVSIQSLGMDKAVIDTAARTESMLFLREQYASVLAETQDLERRGVFGVKSTRKPHLLLENQAKQYRSALGEQFVVELNSLKKHFDRLYEQSQFLYVELLMSEKEQLMGRELHASNKIDRISQRKNIDGWGEKTQSWGDNRLNEYWWDEVGFYILNTQPMCKTGH